MIHVKLILASKHLILTKKQKKRISIYKKEKLPFRFSLCPTRQKMMNQEAMLENMGFPSQVPQKDFTQTYVEGLMYFFFLISGEYW